MIAPVTRAAQSLTLRPAEIEIPAAARPCDACVGLVPRGVDSRHGIANLTDRRRARRPLRPGRGQASHRSTYRLCQLVCSGELDLGTAQAEIRDDWIESYRKRFKLKTAKEQRMNIRNACRHWTDGLSETRDPTDAGSI
jgi:hypothetical protein